MMLHKFRIALAAIIVAAAAVTAVDSASAGDLGLDVQAYLYYDALVESSLFGGP
jgi:hypothetical protein